MKCQPPRLCRRFRFLAARTTCSSSLPLSLLLLLLTFISNHHHVVMAQTAASVAERQEQEDVIYIAGIMDTTTYTWLSDIFQFTVEQINQRSLATVELFRNVLPAALGTSLRYTLSNSDCDETTAVKEYWDVRISNSNQPPDGIVGARCSGASVSLARISQQEHVPMLSPASNSAKLTSLPLISDENWDVEFPYFNRMVAPNDKTGEVGALVALMDYFSWDHIITLSTDTQFAKDLTTAFRKTFHGTIAYSDIIPVQSNGDLDSVVLGETFSKIPRGHDGSRIILLSAHNQHAFQILQKANQLNFQPDTVWVGMSSWIDRTSPGGITYDLPKEFPGYLGVAPYRNRNEIYQQFRNAYITWLENNNNNNPYDGHNLRPDNFELPTFAAETVDAIVALTKALVQIQPPFQRHSQSTITALRQLDFDGVSGRVQFTSQGDRKDPKYSIVNAYGSHSVTTTTGSSGSGGGGLDVVDWRVVGSVGTKKGSVELDPEQSQLCFADLGCVDNPAQYPKATYPEPPTKLPGWVWAVIILFALAFAVMAYKYCSSRQKKERLKNELNAFKNSVVGMQVAQCDYIPRVGVDLVDVEKGLRASGITTASTKTRSSSLTASTTTTTSTTANGSSVKSSVTGTFSVQTATTIQWCWKETKSQMSGQKDTDIFGDPNNCWIKYNDACNKKLEAAYQAGKKSCSPLDGYKVTFKDMKQTKISTKYQRDVQRVVEKNGNNNNNNEIHLDGVRVGDALPKDLMGEPQMVLIESDIVQISKKRDDGWAFGTKLHHADEAAARELVSVAAGVAKGDVDVDANVFPDTGWFQLDCTRIPMPDDLEALKKNVGDTGALSAPSHWDDVKDPTVVQKHELKQGDSEYNKVIEAFMSTLKEPYFRKKVRVVKIERIQNLAMWQSYIVKRQTICYRETGHTADGDNNDDVMRKALARFERSWLWHGTNAEVMDKIQQQGFNRSFCGKNATMYGKGVYFARDASYSAHPIYAVPDWKGNQYMMACRVVVGEYCKGRQDALTPDVRDHKSHSLYDSTVGLKGHDTMARPTIFVTYHDAQAYPEYLITFKTWD